MRLVALAGPLVLSLGGCGIFAMQKDFDALKAQSEELKKQASADKANLESMKADLAATRERLDNALRANADTGSDLLSSKARLNDLAGRSEEMMHGLEQIRADLLTSRTELDSKIDELKRAQAVQPTPPPPPVQIPPDKNAHFQALQTAFAQKDWGLVRTLGHEFVNRYGTDDKADDALYAIGSADLQDNRPASALGEFNKILKVYPKSDRLDRTLFDMGDAYLVLHDCGNAKLAFSTCAQRFPKDKTGQQAKARLQSIEKPAAGMCAPQ